MNWRVSRLDRFALVSNSDAHSPAKLGREATLFDFELDYFAMRRALQTRQGLRARSSSSPRRASTTSTATAVRRAAVARREPRARGKCPACGKPVTVGVIRRVEELADRRPASGRSAAAFQSLVPLGESWARC